MSLKRKAARAAALAASGYFPHDVMRCDLCKRPAKRLLARGGERPRMCQRCADRDTERSIAEHCANGTD